MSTPNCPVCDMNEVLECTKHYECVTCGHEWAKEADTTSDAPVDRVVKDAYGNVLANGDSIAMIKDLKLKGCSHTLKTGAKAKGIRLVDGDHEISCKMDGLAIGLKACFVKKITE